jgi:hypothetical protein
MEYSVGDAHPTFPCESASSWPNLHPVGKRDPAATTHTVVPDLIGNLESEDEILSTLSQNVHQNPFKINQGLLNLNCSISIPITMAGGFETRPYTASWIRLKPPNLHPVEKRDPAARITTKPPLG